MVKLVAVTSSTRVHEMAREVVDVALRDTDNTPVERETHKHKNKMSCTYKHNYTS